MLHIAQEMFGLNYLFPYQRLVITNILSAAQGGETLADQKSGLEDRAEYGRQIVILPTGAGKSLCFQLPAATLKGITLVIYPLLSLMNDQARRMKESGFTVVQLKGGQSAEERRTTLETIVSGAVDFVITNPETLQNGSVLESLRTVELMHAVIDEAHCISEWGDSFRPVYLTLGDSLAALNVPIITAFTATAGDHVLTRIRDVLFKGDDIRVIRGNPDRENISYSVVGCISRIHAIRTIFSRTCTEIALDPSAEVLPVWSPGRPIPVPAIVFCATRADTRLYAAHLERILGPGRTFYYHAGLDRDQKKSIEEQFFNADDGVLCATCAYGMGVDKSNIRAVVHTYLPLTVESFLQESGRGGRDRRPAYSVVLVDPFDELRYRNARRSADTGIKTESASTTPGEPTIVEKMVFGEECRREVLLRAMGMEPAACSGCDRCRGSDDRGETVPGVPHATPTAIWLHRTISRSRCRYTTGEWTRILRGVASWQDHCRGFSLLAGFGVLANWTATDLRNGIDGLVALGLLREGRHGRLMAVPIPRGHRRGHFRQFRSRRLNGSPPTIPDAENNASLTTAAARRNVSG